MFKFLKTILLAVYRTLAISFPTMMESVVGRVSHKRCDQRLKNWADRVMNDCGADIEIKGLENFNFDEPALLMSNHQSLYDIPVLFKLLPSMRMIAKKELFKVPIWGQAMHAAGIIAIDRQNRTKAIRSLKRARESMEKGTVIWIAPEGTRSRDGSLLPFKKGGFALAEEMGVPILPITISGTRDILPAKTLKLNFGAKVRVTIHPRVPVGPREQMAARVREAIGQDLH